MRPTKLDRTGPDFLRKSYERLEHNAEEPGWAYAKRANEPVSEAFGEWIEGLAEWRWFVTRSLGDEQCAEYWRRRQFGRTEGNRGFSKSGLSTARWCLLDLLERTECKRYAAVFEMQERGIPHVHALLADVRAIDGGVEKERDYRKWGLARWKKYIQGAGASTYLGKYLAKDIIELYIGDCRPEGISDLMEAKL